MVSAMALALLCLRMMNLTWLPLGKNWRMSTMLA
ncbi:UNVERIFIED_CONTAM: hypothetical protein GTU68_003931 [Idotea baltica]|nr:hypothetical protein [Idotea baltica]